VTLEDDLRALGLGAGDRLVVHSSLRAVRHTADDVIDALLEVVGPDGLVVMPTFSYDSARFDPRTTPGRTGALPEAFRRRPGAIRSLHPFYSVAAVGDGAAELCAGHELLSATAAGTPLDRVAGAGGFVLLLGVGQTANTTIHVGESHADVAYLEIPFDPTWPTEAEVETGEDTVSVSYDRFPGCSRAFGLLERPLRARGSVRDGRVGSALAQVLPGRAVVEETVALLAGDPAALLCTDPACYRCSRARLSV
jgi:aminoglycoside 3-N-acetyltransferase